MSRQFGDARDVVAILRGVRVPDFPTREASFRESKRTFRRRELSTAKQISFRDAAIFVKPARHLLVSWLCLEELDLTLVQEGTRAAPHEPMGREQAA